MHGSNSGYVRRRSLLAGWACHAPATGLDLMLTLALMSTKKATEVSLGGSVLAYVSEMITSM